MIARLDLAYDGSHFAGWAAQPGQRTVEGELRAALGQLLGKVPELTVAGRTDRGVHAEGQVVSHPGAPAPADALNALLPGDVAVLASVSAADGFDARADACSRIYRYDVLHRRVRSPLQRERVLHWPRETDRAQLQACAALLPGTHHFTAFTPAGPGYKHFRREVLAASWLEDGDLLRFEIEARSFLRHMNRTLVGTMLEVAGGRRSLEDFEALLGGGAQRREAGPTAPPHGLCLTDVAYPPRP